MSESLQQHIDGIFVAVVEVISQKTDQPGYRRRVFLSLQAAQRAVDRAQAKGLQAEVHLCRLERLEGAGPCD